jgi:tRNA A-37 threonylcarbamoyl transferase component Bud32
MNNVQLTHPAGERLAAFGLGQLTDDELADIESHLAHCDACRRVAEDVADDTLVALLRSTATEPDSFTADGPAPSAPATASESPAVAAAPGLPAALADHPRYRVLELVGVGGMGAVYKAEHVLMGRPVALKVLNRELIDRPATAERFRREARAAAQLAHPNIVAAFDAEQAGDTHFLVMEYVDGVSLARLVADRGPLPVAEACDYVRQTALGLQHAQERGMVHRDIKPQNLMRTPVGQIKILDFGLARFAMENAADAQPAPARPEALAGSLTLTGMVMGTPDYIAPEQARDAHAADIRADIYSLGCTLYHLLAGHAPFPEGTVVQKVKAHMEHDPRPLTAVRPDVPPELVRVIERMTAKEPADRLQTPAEVLGALTPFLAPPPRPPRFKRWFAAAAAGLAAVFLAGVVIYVETDKGTLVIQTNDAEITTMIRKAGGVNIIDESNGRIYVLQPGGHDLRSGEYRVQVSDPAAGYEFDVREFKLTRDQTVRVTARFVPKPAVAAAKAPAGGLTMEAFAWFPDDCTLFAARDLRAHPGLSDEQMLILAQVLADAGLRDRIWKLKSILGRIDRISAAFAPDRADWSKSRVFLRLTGQINRRRVGDWLRSEFRNEFWMRDGGWPGGQAWGQLWSLPGFTASGPAVVLLSDTDLLLAVCLGVKAGPKDDPVRQVRKAEHELSNQVVEARASRWSATVRVERLWDRVPRDAWGLILGEPVFVIPPPVRRLLVGRDAPFRALPHSVILSLQGQSTVDARLEAVFDAFGGGAMPADRWRATQEASALSFAESLRALQRRAITIAKDPPEAVRRNPVLRHVPVGLADLVAETLQGLKVETSGNRVIATMPIRDQALAAAVDALRGFPLSVVRSVLPPLVKLLDVGKAQPAAVTDAQETKVTVVTVKDADPAGLAAKVRQLLGDNRTDVTVVAQPELHCLVIRANAAMTERVKKLIQRLDMNHP